jgi:hypothetical protein
LSYSHGQRTMEALSIPNILTKVRSFAETSFDPHSHPRLCASWQMNHLDKDFRYMALSDLAEALKKDSFKLDNTQETKIVGE